MVLSACLPISTNPKGQELVKHGTALFPVACYHDDLSTMEVSWHWHEEVEVFVVEQGTARVCINGNNCFVKQGEGFFINTGILHGVWQQGETPCYLRSIVFHARFVGGSVDSIIWQKYLAPLLSNSCCSCFFLSCAKGWEKDVIKAINAAWNLCASEKDGFEFRTRELLSKIIFLLSQNLPLSQKEPSKKDLRDGKRIKTMLQYIQEHYSEEISLSQIAESANISESECLRCFKSLLGHSPIQYVKQIRIQKATDLLLGTNLTISDIGRRCGFIEMSYFAKTFKELKGLTPSIFRTRNCKSLSQNS